MKAPCYGCPDRYPGCHDHCDKYKEWKAKYDEAKKRSEEERYSLYVPESQARKRAYDHYLKDTFRGRKKY